MKLMIVGQENIGKTTLVRCLASKWTRIKDGTNDPFCILISQELTFISLSILVQWK